MGPSFETKPESRRKAYPEVIYWKIIGFETLEAKFHTTVAIATGSERTESIVGLSCNAATTSAGILVSELQKGS